LTYEIRLATLHDTLQIAGVKAAGWPDEKTNLDLVAGVLRSGDHVTQIAIQDEEIVGFINGFSTRSQSNVLRWEVDLLAVHPLYRQRGLAQLLIAASTESGRQRGASFARALIHVDNVASQRAFAGCGYTVESQVCLLVVCPTDFDALGHAASQPPSLYLIQVMTLNYRGIWLEGQVSLRGFSFAQQTARRLGLNIAGAVIPLAQAEVIYAAQEHNLNPVGYYQWWLAEL
jgi:GNAT superfamily N-acetyltransferase